MMFILAILLVTGAPNLDPRSVVIGAPDYIIQPSYQEPLCRYKVSWPQPAYEVERYEIMTSTDMIHWTFYATTYTNEFFFGTYSGENHFFKPYAVSPDNLFSL